MPKNDYLRFVRKVIFELNLKDDKEVLEDYQEESEIGIPSPKKKLNRKLDHDINSNSVLEINNIMDSDGKPDDDEPTPVNKNQGKKFKTMGKSKKSNKGNSNVLKGAILMKEEKQMKDSSTQCSPRDPPKMLKKDFGVSVVPQINKKVNTSTVSCCTDLTMNSKELTSIITANNLEKGKKSSNKKGPLEEFQDTEIMNQNYDLKAFNQSRKRQKSNEKQKKKAKGHSHDSLKQTSKIGASTPEGYVSIKDERRNIRTVNTQEESPKSKRRVRRSVDNYRHPDFDNYLLNQTHYHHSLNAFPRGTKFQKDLGMRGMMMKKNKYKESLAHSDVSGSMLSKYRTQTNSDKSVKNKKKRTNSSDVAMVYHPSAKKGYPQLKSALANYPKNPSSGPESTVQTGRKRRANSQ